MAVYELLYVSRAQVELTQDELEAFLGPSRVRNAGSGITGVLLHVHERGASAEPYRFVQDEEVVRRAFFVQLLEGTQELVEQTYQRIQRDELHQDFVVLSRTDRPARSFEAWHMRWMSLTAAAVLARASSVSGVEELLQDSQFVRGLLLQAAHESSQVARVGQLA